MFLHQSVILFTGGVYNVTSCLAAWSHVPSGGGLLPVGSPSMGKWGLSPWGSGVSPWGSGVSLQMGVWHAPRY